MNIDTSILAHQIIQIYDIEFDDILSRGKFTTLEFEFFYCRVITNVVLL